MTTNPSAVLPFRSGSHIEIAKRLALRDKPRAVFAADDFYRYSPAGIWQVAEPSEIEREIHELDGHTITVTSADGATKASRLKLRRGDVTGVRDSLRAELAEQNFFSTATAGVAFADCFVRVVDGEIRREKHAPEHRARHGLPFPYAPDGRHPELNAFFEELFLDEGEEERAIRVATIRDFLGTCLIGDAPKHQRALLLFGEGDNGKSQVEAICRACFPDGAVCSLPPQYWDDRFRLRMLDGKLANICDEIPEREILASEVFKSVITGEPQTGERKYHDPFVFVPNAGHIFSANRLPKSKDVSKGFFRRWLIIRLDRDMRKAARHEPGVAKRIIAAERPAIVSWALEGAATVQRRGGYEIPESSERTVRDWQGMLDSVAEFLRARTIPADRAKAVGQGNGTAASRLYSSYRMFADATGERYVSASEMKSRLAAAGVHGRHTKAGSFYPVILRPTQ